MKKLIKILAMFMVMGWLLLIMLWRRFGRDISAPDTRDLVVERLRLLAEENAYTHFMDATDVFCWPTNASFVSDDMTPMRSPAQSGCDSVHRSCAC